MKILWLTWKDRDNPQAGGAELANEELAKRLVGKGHEITFIVHRFKDSDKETSRDGFRIKRVGSPVTVFTVFPSVIFGAFWSNRKNADIIIDEMNTLPFFTGFYGKKKSILLAYQLTRKIWFYQLPKILGVIGYVLEPVMLRLLSRMSVITISESSKQDLMRFGFKEEKINIITMGYKIERLNSLDDVKKFSKPTLISMGSIRPMKRNLDQIKAFESAKEEIPELQLKVAGRAPGKFGGQVLDRIASSKFVDDIEFIDSPLRQQEKRIATKKATSSW